MLSVKLYFSHIFGEGNMVADKLVNFGVGLTPAYEICSLLFHRGTVYPNYKFY